MNKDTQPLMVTIQCFTYNQEQYIRQCLDGFVMQKTNFRFEAIVHDDASTDGTADIIREYEAKYPDIIKPIYETENQYSKHDGSLVRIMNEHMHGKYIAVCEGDDYWIDPLKLQKQVDFLANNPDYGMVCSASKIYKQGIGMKKGSYGHEYRGIEDLLKGNYIFNASVLKRKSLEELYNLEIGFHPDWKMGDWPRILHCAIVSKIGYINEAMSVYRVLPNSASHFDDFDKFKAFNENSVEVSKFFIDKYNLDSDKLYPILDNWLKRRLLLRACSLGYVDMVNKYKSDVIGLSSKEKINVFVASHYLTNAIYRWYNNTRKAIQHIF